LHPTDFRSKTLQHKDLLGRNRELTALEAGLSGTLPRVVHVHGIPGVGKSHLLATAAARAETGGATVFRVDCRSAEPTSRGFLGELRSLLGSRSRLPAKLAQQLGRAGGRVLLILDNYEQFRLLDTWFRQDFVPVLPENVRVVLASRQRPSAGWVSDLALGGSFQSIHLGPLDETSSLQFLKDVCSASPRVTPWPCNYRWRR
jgi:hypothetical protein